MRSDTMRILLLSFFAVGSLFAYKPVPLTEGQGAPDFKLPGVDGKNYTLKDFSGGKSSRGYLYNEPLP